MLIVLFLLTGILVLLQNSSDPLQNVFKGDKVYRTSMAVFLRNTTLVLVLSTILFMFLGTIK